MKRQEQRMLMGNEALGRGLFESGCSLVASYPGTPASEILSSVVTFSRETDLPIHIEWSINEKVAYDVALAHSYTGKRAAVAMKQVGLNVASDPFMRSAYLGIKGGFVVIAADDPGPHSSQTEQDSRLFAHFARVPVFDPSCPREAKEMVGKAFALSERYEIPVMVRPTTRVCHARQNVASKKPKPLERRAHFEKNPSRWAATPQFIYDLHKSLNEKIDRIADEHRFYPVSFAGQPSRNRQCVVASGVAFAHTYELLEDLGLMDRIDLFQVLLPYPLNRRFMEQIQTDYERLLVVEETYPVIELQLRNGHVQGRESGLIPRQGELTPDIIQESLERFIGKKSSTPKSKAASGGKKPSLCAGCPHRPAFYAIKRTFPRGIFPSDIGCYTLGINLGAVDTCHCMGACIGQGAGFYHAYAQDGQEVPPIVVTIGDSTFFHAGIPGLINAVVQGARFILAILDNSTTAMTGHQPPPHSGIRANGNPAQVVSIPDIVTACGVKFLRECDPYDVTAFSALLEEADRHCRSDAGGVAVIISKRSCPVDKRAAKPGVFYVMEVSDACDGCRLCLKQFECPALAWDGPEDRPRGKKSGGKVRIDQTLCARCGVCRNVCPKGAFTVVKEVVA
jgi:indolepyruvate ferredoxin oxidoreductase alpha subunit